MVTEENPDHGAASADERRQAGGRKPAWQTPVIHEISIARDTHDQFNGPDDGSASPRT